MNIQPGELLTSYLAFSSITLFISAFICVNLLTPIVIWVSFQKRLVTPVNKRSSHRSSTPPFGGVAFFMIFIVFISIIQSILNESIGYNIIAATSILFMIGLKDDLVHSTAKVKLLAQLLASAFTIFSAEFRILTDQFISFNFDPTWSVLFSACLLILIINAYNLIDGVDGLAAMTGMVVCIVYAFLFYINKDLFFFLLSVVTLGMLSAFLRFNLSSKKLKIFMGDCGSLIIGLIIGLCTLRFLAFPFNALLSGTNLFSSEYRLLMICAILFIPFLDTSRIIIIRLIRGRSPFKADKNHVHHILIHHGLSHLKASLILSAVQIFVIITFVMMSEFFSISVLYMVMASIYVMTAFILQRIAGSGNSETKNQYINF